MSYQTPAIGVIAEPTLQDKFSVGVVESYTVALQ